jgi:flagellar hook-associated protein 3 FlgL
MTRVSNLGTYQRTQGYLERANSDVARTRMELASGRRIVGFADGPTDAMRASELVAELATLDTQRQAAGDAATRLARQDNALQQMSTALIRVRELAVSSVSGSVGTNARQAIADEIDELRASLVDLANSREGQQALFGGFGGSAVVDGPNGAVFVGDAGVVQRRVGENQVVQVNIDGRAAFGFAAGDDVFRVLSELSANVRSGATTTVSNDLDRLEARADSIRTALGRVGTLTNEVERSVTTNAIRAEEVRSRRASLVDTDYAEAALELSRNETAYQAALASASRLQQSPSLLDYLR